MTIQLRSVVSAWAIAPGRFLRNLSIAGKLALGFGALVALTLLVVALTYGASAGATATIQRTGEVRVPVALASSHAQADLLRMSGDVQGYLAMGERRFVVSYQQSEHDFATDLESLEALAQGFDPENQRRVDDLRQAFEQWKLLPDRLFALRDDQMEREPAYRWLHTRGTRRVGEVLIIVNQMIAAQEQGEISRQNMELIDDMNTFRSSLEAMFAGLRGYVTTRNPNFRHYEYELNQKINADAWSRVERSPALLTGEQRTRLDMVRRTRTAIIDEVPTAVFTVMESERWREDLYLFESQGEPLTVEMQRLLLELTESQQQALRDDLNIGSERLSSSRLQSLAGGSLAVILGIALALAFWRAISAPVSQLTGVAMRIQRGDLEITAPVESGDELGMFARTFNSMTTQLRQILSQVRKEKQRADDLLNIVIPIGVTLSSERNFDRLLEQMLAEAMSYCGADCGALFLRSDTKLRLVLLRITSQGVILGESSEVPMDLTPLDLADERPESTDSRHPAAHVVRTGATLNLADLDHAPSAFALSRFEVSTGEANYQPLSLLALPLKTTHGEVLGVLQLINAQTPEANQAIPFDTNLQQMMESFSLLAVTALESYAREQRLRQEIRQLRIEIDERKRHEQVNEIVESDFFQDLQLRAQALRSRRRG